MKGSGKFNQEENMQVYKVYFHGRLKSSVGICFPIVDTVEAPSKEDVVLRFYDKYEHIKIYTIVEKGKGE